MQFPSFIARPLFTLVYKRNRRASPIPPIKRVVQPPPANQQAAFDNLLDSTLEQGPNTPVDCHLPYPKVDFLNYICDWRSYVAHGSPFQRFTTLQPVRLTQDSSEFRNRRQIFCSPDGTWALWFAILDKSKIHITENGCVRLGHGPGRIKFYHFDLPADNKENPPFTNGMVYFAKASDFPEHRPYPVLDWFDAEIEEWGSANLVFPLAKLHVAPSDFPYLDKVQFYL
ncbi:MAG: hypothetical protein ABSG01_10560 [Anaerolineales bacterium]|jgi:hypothetical protein